MSANTVDYGDARVDAGGDKAYDSSNYGTTTGDLKEPPSSGDFGPGKERENKSTTGTEGLRASGQDVVNHEQWGKNSGKAGQSGGFGSEASDAPSQDGALDTEHAKAAQGYTKGGDSNPTIGA